MSDSLDKDLAPKGKNSLTIRLTEAAVFLRSDGTIHDHAHPGNRSSVLRGLLILNIAKPTRISGIDIELIGKSEISIPEGAASVVTEQHSFYRASTTYFKAGKIHSRRPASVGPGLPGTPDHDHDDSWEELHSSLRQHSSNADHESEGNHISSNSPSNYRRRARNASVDTSHHQSQPISHFEEQLPHVPPYSPPYSPLYTLSPSYSSSSQVPSPVPTPYSLTRNPSPAQSSDDFRTTLSRNSDSFHGRNLSSTHHGSHTPRTGSPHPDDHEIRGRRKHHSRFTLSSVSHVIRDAMPILTRSRESSRDRGHGFGARGRTLEMSTREHFANSNSQPTELDNTRAKTKHHKEHLLNKVGEMLRLDAEHKTEDRDWKEFKKGVYTYPISFQIPADAPPSMHCDYGFVSWRLQAHVHRPGAFRTKYTAGHDVVVIAYPTEDDTEENENITIERHWDQQLQYLISVAGRSFAIGGSMPITFTMLPLTKAKVYRINVFLEEHVEYLNNMRKAVFASPVRRFELLGLRGPVKSAMPILPLESDESEAFRNSPIYSRLSSQLKSEDDISQMASNLMGPGPWTFALDLKLPQSCKTLRPTNKNKLANMVVTHSLKIVMRMQRGDDTVLDSYGRRKLFDVVVRAPVHILSCRCNPEWTSLPRYSEGLNPVEPVGLNCPCRTRVLSQPDHIHNHRQTGLSRVSSRESIDSHVSATDDQPVNPALMASLRRHTQNQHDLMIANTLFERLVSGQQTESGETPPSYEAASTEMTTLPGVGIA
ncbi:hypothetical protein AGABI2DRAFT_185545 [Agaricus bisporus var. bisporus H97]|uniref:hypothetical protein n=1 Tax=Agaricus bisporus var. bisporus (strain H97 / ATCC MYA-4626 / FGSC 10389) TaxID=936046 RepID=UPI00029F6873|nr:hypothetical protein AGABI2DRAFT_185545 [Agaricus bisporus var. bisporus H97]EKV47621.1 hypothetical protein AGABI2DRAFT_185545 [Agaricus bisporus var. bisporus H97]